MFLSLAYQFDKLMEKREIGILFFLFFFFFGVDQVCFNLNLGFFFFYPFLYSDIYSQLASAACRLFN